MELPRATKKVMTRTLENQKVKAMEKVEGNILIIENRTSRPTTSSVTLVTIEMDVGSCDHHLRAKKQVDDM